MQSRAVGGYCFMTRLVGTENPWQLKHQQTGDISDAFVFFGATGDLAYKKIFPALYGMVQHGTLKCPVIGIAKSGWDLSKLCERARESVQMYGAGWDEKVFVRLVKQLRYIDGDYADPATFTRLRQELGDASSPIHYLAIPPSMFATVVEQLHVSRCSSNARIVVEKPFGRDLASSEKLNKILQSQFPEWKSF